MRALRLLAAFAFLAALSPSRAQQPVDPLSEILANGKVVHFDSADQKAKFDAARARVKQEATNPGPAAVPAASSSATVSKLPWVSLAAKNFTAGGQFSSEWESGWGSYIRDTKRAQTIEIDLTNKTAAPVALHVVVVFVARMIESHQQYKHAAITTDLTLVGDATLGATCPPTQMRDTNLAALGTRNIAGAELEGWFVQVFEAGGERRNVAFAGSSQPFEREASQATAEDVAGIQPAMIKPMPRQ